MDASCPECGAKVASADNFCIECGTELPASPGHSSRRSSEPQAEQSRRTGASSERQADPEPELSDPTRGVGHGLLAVGLSLFPSFVFAISVAQVLRTTLQHSIWLGGIVAFTYLGYKRPTKASVLGRLSFWWAIGLWSLPLLVFVSNLQTKTKGQLPPEFIAAILAILVGVFTVPVGLACYFLSRRYDIDD